MLWEYVYIGNEIVRSSMVGLCNPSPTKEAKVEASMGPADPAMAYNNNRPKKAGHSIKKNISKGLPALVEAKGLGALLALEPRIMFDGAAFITGAEVVQDQVAQDLPTPNQDHQGTDTETETSADPFTNSLDLLSALSSATTSSNRNEIVFIDTRVKDYHTLMDGIAPNAEVILLNSRRDGIEQIAEALRGRSNIDGIHLIAEGNEAELHLGTTFLTQEAISGRYANLFTEIGHSLSADADLLIYGCNFGEGEAGRDAMETLAELTGADIAASTDRTGHSTEYADWELEVATGTIETSIVIGEATQEAWEGVLATFTVTTTTDGGGGSLRQAIIDANANAGTDTITFTGSGTYLLTITGAGEDAAATGDLDITDDLIIIGNGTGNTVIDASGFGGTPDRVFHLLGTSTVTMSGITIQNGNLNAAGGGIFVDDSSVLNLSDTTLTGNNSGASGGGAIHVHGTAHLDGVLMTGNTAVSGGAIGYHSADGGSLTNVTISGNTTTGNGGGLWNDSNITVTNSTIDGNSANLGGGIYNEGTIDISNTTVNGNMANTGAGIYNDMLATDLTLTNVTVSSNIATSAGGGLWTQESATIVNSTFTLNSADAGGGIRTQGGSGNVGLLNTIVAGNTAGSANPDLQGTFTTSGFNLIGDGTGQSNLVDGLNNDQVGSGGSPINALLGGLANNGGPTHTHALLVGSLAINAGTTTGAPALDQRGMARDANVDIGAYEVTGNTAPTADAGGPYLINEGDSLVVNASASSDPDPDTLTYTWDLDGDGLFDDASGVNPTITWATLNAMTNPINDDGSYTVTVRVDDGNSGVTTDSVALTVNNLAPTLTTTGAATTASGGSYTLNLSASDSGDDTISGWTINWGDGTIDTIAGNPPSVTHTYTNSGLTFNILASATDEDGTFLQNELLVPRYTADSIFRFEETTGAFLQQFAPQSGGLDDPIQTIIGPDGNLYVTGEFSDNVVRYNPITGTKIDEFVTGGSGGLNSPGGLAFGPDGNLYVASYQNNRVLRFDGTTGAFIDTFATGVTRAYGVEFGPDGNLYVSSFTGNTVLKFDGTTGASLGTFVTANAGGLSTPERMTFGPDGHLYIASSGSDEVLRYNGTTGAFINAFVTAGLGGLNSPGGIDFGPDGNLYVSGQISDNILRYDGATGAFLGEYVSAATGLDRPAIFTFLPGHQVLVIDSPPVNTLPGAQVVAEDTAIGISGLSVTDVDGNLSTVQLTVIQGRVTVALSGGASISAGGSGTNTLTLSGTETDINATLTSLSYQGNLDYNGPDTLTVTSTDANSATDVGMVAITVTAVNDAPIITNLDGDTLPYVTASGALVIDQSMAAAVSDVDSTNFDTGTLTAAFTAGNDNAEDELGIQNVGTNPGEIGVSGATVTYGGVTIGTFTGGGSGGGALVVTLNTLADATAVSALIQNITYENTDLANPTVGARTVSFTITDGDGDTSLTSDTTINVSAQVAPVITNLGGDTLAYTEGDGAAVIEQGGNAAVSDVDSANFDTGTLTVAFTAGNDNAEDELGIQNVGTNPGEIGVSGATVTYGGVTIGTFTGGGSGGGALVVTLNTLADATAVSALVQNITYENTDTDNPTTSTRTVQYVLTDGDGGTSLNYNTTVTVAAVNDVPVATGNTVVAQEDVPLVIDSTDFLFTDIEGDSLVSVTITGLNLNGGTLTHTGGTVPVTNGMTVTLAELADLTFTSAFNDSTNSSFTYTVNDANLGVTNATMNITVNAVNDTPVNTVPATATVAEDTALAMTGGNLITVTDVDGNLASTQLTALNGTVTVTLSGSATLSAGGNGSGTLTISGTETDINATLASLVYQGTLNYNGPDTLTTLSTDSAGTPLSDSDDTAITVTSVNTPPIAMPDGFTVNEGSTNTLNVASNDTDADDGLDLTSIAIISGPTNGTITSINTNGTVEYTHNGSETVADSFRYTINDLAGTTSNTVTVSLTVTPQNDIPTITSDGGGANASVSILSGNTAVTDVNATDVEGTPLTYIIAGGADAALFNIDPTTGILTFNNAPDFQAPGDVGGDNIYDVIVQASDGTLTDTQAIAVTITDLPVVVLPPTADPPSDSSPSSDDGEGETEDSEDTPLGGGTGISGHSSANVSTDSKDSAGKDSEKSDQLHHQESNDLSTSQLLNGRGRGLEGSMSDVLDLLKRGFDSTSFKSEIQSLLTTSGFLRDLDQVRDAFQEATANEKTYMASSIAASTGLSVGYVFWLLRSGVLLTALLSSVPAWQFVNPLLVLDTPTKKKSKKDQEDAEEDSVESMFENHTVPTEAAEDKPGREHQSH